MERTIYIVKSKTRKGDVIADFDTYVEAVDCAIEELRKKPYIEACYFDDEHEGLDTCQGTETV